jgi:hypothetical protein
MSVDIQRMASPDQFYIFTDLAERFWPGETGKSNHAAQDRVTERLERNGCPRALGEHATWTTPRGRISFDSESGMFECHSTSRDAVEFVKGVIEEMLAERAELRARLD